MRNKLKQIKNRVRSKKQVHTPSNRHITDNRQGVVIKGLVFILGVSILTYLLILNTGFFSPTYSKPFRDWVTTSWGLTVVIMYLLILVFAIIVTKSERIRKLIRKITSPVIKIFSKITESIKRVLYKNRHIRKVRTRFAGRYSSPSLAKRKKRIAYLV